MFELLPGWGESVTQDDILKGRGVERAGFYELEQAGFVFGASMLDPTVSLAPFCPFTGVLPSITQVY